VEFDDDVFVTPSTPDSWKEVADNFGKRWNFYHACGALDGKYIAIKKPKKSGSAYYNYKGFFSIVLLGLVGAEYKFLWANVGAEGLASFCYRTVIVESSCGASTIDITPYGDRAVPLQAPHGLRTGTVLLVHKRRTTESRNFLRAPHGVSRYVTAQATVAVESYDV